jgi:hypothetical protein
MVPHVRIEEKLHELAGVREQTNIRALAPMPPGHFGGVEPLQLPESVRSQSNIISG